MIDTLKGLLTAMRDSLVIRNLRSALAAAKKFVDTQRDTLYHFDIGAYGVDVQSSCSGLQAAWEEEEDRGRPGKTIMYVQGKRAMRA